MEALESISKFFEYDIKIKKDMMKLSIDEKYMNDKSYIEDFVDQAYKNLYDIIINFGYIMEVLEIDNVTQEYIISFMSEVTNIFYECGYNPIKLQTFYHDYISDMSPDIISKISANLAANLPTRTYVYPLRTSHTINELLHIFHQYVVNDDILFYMVPNITYPITDNKGVINYRGKESNMANIIVKSLAQNIVYYPYYMDLISINDKKAILLVKGLAHATSFEIDKTEQGDIRVEYFIPKIYEVNAINKLNGIDKVSENASVMRGATGIFYTNEERIGLDIFHIINNIPTEEDLMKSPDRHKRI